jgi:glycosyltransferase involved in cell wall biosynthesis
MQTVFVTPFTPSLDSGRARRTWSIVWALAAAGPVDLVYGEFGAAAIDPVYEGLSDVSFHPVPRPGRLERLPAYARARLRGVPQSFARAIWPGLATATERLAGARPEARVVADGPVAAGALLSLTGRRPVIYNAHNLESAFRHRLGDESIPREQLERFERLILKSCAESWMVSDPDLAGAAALAPEAKLRLVPNVVDVAAIRPVAPRAGQRSVLFVADFSYRPNREGLELLRKAVMPRIWETAPEVTLTIAGKGSEAASGGDERIAGLGFAPDLAALYEAAGCVAVPLLEGGGSPLKFVEALAYGAPIVATPRAAAGLHLTAGEQFLAAAPAGAAFGDAILAALEPTTGNRLGRAARAIAEREYSFQALERILLPALARPAR